jgi:tetratricopeptide (TPR) repeat protein
VKLHGNKHLLKKEQVWELHEQFDCIGYLERFVDSSNRLALSSQGKYDQALQYHNKALAINEVLQDKVGMARNYENIGDVLANTKNRKVAIESFHRGLEALKDLEEAGHHHPLMEIIQGHITKLQEDKNREGKIE